MSGWARERRGSWRDRPDSQLWAPDPTCGRGSSCKEKAEEGGSKDKTRGDDFYLSLSSLLTNHTRPGKRREGDRPDRRKGDREERPEREEIEGKRGGALHRCKRPWRLICSKVTAALSQGSSGPDPHQVLHHAALQDLLCCSSSPRIFLCCSSSRPTPKIFYKPVYVCRSSPTWLCCSSSSPTTAIVRIEDHQDP